MIEENETMRGVTFWTKEIRKAGIYKQIPHFNDLITGSEKPTTDMQPVKTDISLGGEKVDIYHWGGTSARLYLHIKA